MHGETLLYLRFEKVRLPYLKEIILFTTTEPMWIDEKIKDFPAKLIIFVT